MIKVIVIFLTSIQFCLATHLFAKENYHPISQKEMEIPKLNQPTEKELNKISEDLGLNHDRTVGYTGKESKDIAPIKSKRLNIIQPIYSYAMPLENIYSQTADCNILKYDYNSKKWKVIYSEFNQKGYEPYKIVVSPNEKYIGIIMAPDGGKGFYIKVLNLETRKLKNIGIIDGIGWYFFKKDSSSFVIVEQYGGKVTEIMLND